MSPSADRLFAALDATWPPVYNAVCGPFRLREGAGGGRRVSATVLKGAFSDAALDTVEAQDDGATLFQIRPGQSALDHALAARGYTLIDPTALYVAPIEAVAQNPRPVSLLAAWPPLAMQRQIWLDGGIGPARVAVMERACTPKMAFIARHQNRVAGAGFIALHDAIAMLHALRVEPDFRRQGVARFMAHGMAHWAQEQGAQTLALAVTRANTAARGLYSALGMTEVATYHYREKPTWPD